MTTRIKLLILSLFFLSLSCKTYLKNEKQDEIEFGTDIINNETIALKYAELVFQNRYINVDFDIAKPFEIRLIEDGKIWYIIAEDKRDVIKKNSFHIKILKNNGKVLDIWTVK